MRSDHWNFLANLLGTPGPPEPPQEDPDDSQDDSPKATRTESSEPRAGAQEGSEVPQASSSRGQTASEPMMTDPTDSDRGSSISPARPEESSSNAPVSDAELLSALKSVTPPPQLPGFGPSNQTMDPPLDELAHGARETAQPTTSRDTMESSPRSNSSGDDDSVENSSQAGGESLEQDDQSEHYEQAWGDLAQQLGVDADPPPRPEFRSETPSSGQRGRTDSPKKPAKRSRGGFGNGLGLDLGPEPEEDISSDFTGISAEEEGILAEEDIDVVEDRDELFAEASRDDADSDVDEPISPRGRHRGRRPRGRSRPEDRSPESGRRQTSAREEEEEAESEFSARRFEGSGDDEAEPPRRRGRRGSRQRSGTSDVQRDVGSDRPDRESSRRAGRPRREEPLDEEDDRQGRGPRVRRDSLDEDLRGERDDSFAVDDLENDFDSEITAKSDDKSDDRPKRSRRRGRRGRGSRDDYDSRAVEKERDSSETRRGSRSGGPESAFDDDHEDDAEVEVIRRGRRPRSRSDADDADDVDDERGGGRGGRGRPRRRSRGDSDTGVSDRDSQAPRRRDVPTWLETIEIFVNANIENHKRSSRGGGGGGGGGGRGRGGKRRG